MTTTTSPNQHTSLLDKTRWAITHPLRLIGNRYFIQTGFSLAFVILGTILLSAEGAGGGTVSVSFRLWSSITIAIMVLVLAVVTAIYIISAKAWMRLLLLSVLFVLIGPFTYWTMFLWAGALTKMAQVGLIQSQGGWFVLIGIVALVLNAVLIFRIGYTGTHKADLIALRNDISVKDEMLNGAAKNPDGSYQVQPKVNKKDDKQYVFVGAVAKSELAQASAEEAQKSYDAIEISHDKASKKAKKMSDKVDTAREKLGLAPDTTEQADAAAKLVIAQKEFAEAKEQLVTATETQKKADAALATATTVREKQTKAKDAAHAATALVEASNRVILRQELVRAAEQAKEDAAKAAEISPEALALARLEKENEELATIERRLARKLTAAKNLLDEKNQNVANEGKALEAAKANLQSAKEAYEAKRKEGRSSRFGWLVITALMFVLVPFLYSFGWYALAIAGATHVVYGN
jgi:hypothetical protein